MEAKVKYLEGVQNYWKQITKFPARDYHTRPTQLGDAKWYELSNTGANLRDARKKLEGKPADDLFKELDGLIGLEPVKEQVRAFANLVKVQKARVKAVISSTPGVMSLI